MKFALRLAVSEDVPVLSELIDCSVRRLQAHDYSAAQIASALANVYGVDSQLIADQTYFVVEAVPGDDGVSERKLIVGCGGWSKRKTLYGGDHWNRREDALLDSAHDAAKIRAFFVHPDWTRRGIGSMILEACESAAQAAAFTRFEMGATLTGVALYSARGYVAIENVAVPLPNGESLAIVRMAKNAKSNL